MWKGQSWLLWQLQLLSYRSQRSLIFSFEHFKDNLTFSEVLMDPLTAAMKMVLNQSFGRTWIWNNRVKTWPVMKKVVLHKPDTKKIFLAFASEGTVCMSTLISLPFLRPCLREKLIFWKLHLLHPPLDIFVHNFF